MFTCFRSLFTSDRSQHAALTVLVSLALLILPKNGGAALMPQGELSGQSLNGTSHSAAGSPVHIQAGSKGTVVVFLSSVCPCSNSHISVLKTLSEKYTEFQFVGINSNINETVEQSRKYFEAQKLSFPVIRDVELKIADTYHASKTPHVFVVGTDGEILYRGGVTSSASANQADKPYLANALEEIRVGKPVSVSSTRTLGCAISRGE